MPQANEIYTRKERVEPQASLAHLAKHRPRQALQTTIASSRGSRGARKMLPSTGTMRPTPPERVHLKIPGPYGATETALTTGPQHCKTRRAPRHHLSQSPVCLAPTHPAAVGGVLQHAGQRRQGSGHTSAPPPPGTRQLCMPPATRPATGAVPFPSQPVSHACAEGARHQT